MQDQEALLHAWMDMNVRIRGNRLLRKLSFNEMMVMSILYRHHDVEEAMTATELGAHMRLLKSEMNKLLSSMEQRKLILRSASTRDRRKIELHINPAMLSLYLEEHERVMRYLDRIERTIGHEEVAHLALLLQQATQAVDEEAAQ